MKICFHGLSSPTEVAESGVTTIEVHNRVLFARLCDSLMSEEGKNALEPYSLWGDKDAELKPKGQFLFVNNPCCLPWDDRSLTTALLSSMERLLYEDDDYRSETEEAFRVLCTQFANLTLCLHSDYAFKVDWDSKKYLKSFGFSVDFDTCETLLDKIIMFLMTLKDVGFERVVAFVNLKLFLSERELERFIEQVFFLDLRVLLLENVPSDHENEHERKYIVDQDFIELRSSYQSERSVPLQEGICPNGFGAVSF